jgi:hypothetical protein
VLIEPGPRRPPQIEIEEMRQLRSRSLRDEIDTVLEAVHPDDAMQQLRPQLRCKLGEAVNEFVWQVDESSELTDAGTDCFGIDRRRTIEMGTDMPPPPNPPPTNPF